MSLGIITPQDGQAGPFETDVRKPAMSVDKIGYFVTFCWNEHNKLLCIVAD